MIATPFPTQSRQSAGLFILYSIKFVLMCLALVLTVKCSSEFTIRQCVNLAVDPITKEEEQGRRCEKYTSSFEHLVVETAL